jgi:hypothetical protein
LSLFCPCFKFSLSFPALALLVSFYSKLDQIEILLLRR